jgi:hypothetical protein
VPNRSPEKEKALTLQVDYKPHPKQLQIRKSKARFKVIAAGRRGGKTEYAGATALFGEGRGRRFQGAVQGAKVWWVAPDFGRAAIGWNLAKRLVRDVPPTIMKLSEADKKIEFVTGGFLQIKSGFDPDTLRGEGLDYVILDEAAFIKKKEVWTEALRPALSDRKGGAMFISTPQGFNYFYDLYERGIRREDGGEWESFHFTSYDNPYVDDAEIDAAREDMADHSFRQEYLAEFLEGGGIPVFPREWWAEGKNRYDPADTYLMNRRIGGWIFGDTAEKDRDEHDESVFMYVTMNRRYEMLVVDCISGKWTFDELPYIVTQFARRYYGHGDHRLRRLWIEDASSGTQLLQTLRAAAPPWLAELVTPAKAIPKIQSWEAASVWCRRDFVKFPYPNDDNGAWLFKATEQIHNVSATGSGTRHDDHADVFAGLVRHLSQYFAAAYRRRGEAA